MSIQDLSRAKRMKQDTSQYGYFKNVLSRDLLTSAKAAFMEEASAQAQLTATHEAADQRLLAALPAQAVAVSVLPAASQHHQTDQRR